MRQDKNKAKGEESLDLAEQTRLEIERTLSGDRLLAVKASLVENELLKKLAKTYYWSTLFCAVLAIFTFMAAWVGWSRDVEFRYFYINSDGHIYETRGLSYPTATRESVTNFASRAVTALHTWTYQNYAANFTNLFDYCAPDVVERYYNNLGEQGVFKVATQFKQRYESVVTAARVIQERAVDSTGRMEWRINLRVNEEIIGTGALVQRAYDVVMDVRQVDLTVSPAGLQCVRLDENYIKGQ